MIDVHAEEVTVLIVFSNGDKRHQLTPDQVKALEQVRYRLQGYLCRAFTGVEYAELEYGSKVSMRRHLNADVDLICNAINDI